MTGYTEDELLQADVRVLYAYPEQRVQLLQQLRSEGSLNNFGIQFRRRDDSHYYASLSLSQLEMAGQAVVLGITEDVTEQVEARQALTTLHQMSYDMASITDLSALVNHAVPHLHQIVDFQRAALMLVEAGEESLTIYGFLSPAAPPAFTIHQVPISGWRSLHAALQAGTATYITDMHANVELQAEFDGMRMKQWAERAEGERKLAGAALAGGGAHRRPAQRPA